jgi:hypothetical protein
MKRDPYEAVRGLCAELEAEGHTADIIIDALLHTGLNAGRRLGGHDHIVSYMHKMISVFEAREERHAAPPVMTQ